MTGYGDGDPTIDPRAAAAHAQAVARREAFYRDPLTGFSVMTTLRLLANGRCCGAGCRHCPYSAPEQTAAGRTVVRPR